MRPLRTASWPWDRVSIWTGWPREWKPRRNTSFSPIAAARPTGAICSTAPSRPPYSRRGRTRNRYAQRRPPESRDYNTACYQAGLVTKIRLLFALLLLNLFPLAHATNNDVTVPMKLVRLGGHSYIVQGQSGAAYSENQGIMFY